MIFYYQLHNSQDCVLHVYGVVQDKEVNKPQHFDIYYKKYKLLIKNKLTTKSFISYANSLNSITYIY